MLKCSTVLELQGFAARWTFYGIIIAIGASIGFLATASLIWLAILLFGAGWFVSGMAFLSVIEELTRWRV